MNPTPNSPRTEDSSSTASRSDENQPYIFGRHPTVGAPFPFTPREFARLLVLRGRVQDELVGEGDRQPS
jgi:hypothetical protein